MRVLPHHFLREFTHNLHALRAGGNEDGANKLDAEVCQERLFFKDIGVAEELLFDRVLVEIISRLWFMAAIRLQNEERCANAIVYAKKLVGFGSLVRRCPFPVL